MTCRSPGDIRADLHGFEIEHWLETEEDGTTALGEPHRWHRIDLVALRR